MEATDESIPIDVTVVHAMIEACGAGSMDAIQAILDKRGVLYASQQDTTTGMSPLMAAAGCGHDHVVQYLLQEGGAPWNAVDRNGRCAGDYATAGEHWSTVNALVAWGTRAELILGMVERGNRDNSSSDAMTESAAVATNNALQGIPASHQPCTKPDYLRQRLQYTADGQSLLDGDHDAVMMEWERPLMQAHAQILMEIASNSDSDPTAAAGAAQQPLVRKRVLNVGFGMGIVDTYLQDHQPSHHIIIEAHPDVYRRMVQMGWDRKPNVRICFGKWQDVLPHLIDQGVFVDAIFYDTVRELLLLLLFLYG
jgi:type IV protein arginine methyltransferase